ncbi:Uu.00g104840.m01.CDS01 [Anthostomella pinea]|uniref:Uu.00g104840.m01.CDS01 n=1 Tax=Anthostomella pinea TaxID=933095 RepID=A0AAI8YFV6_9PEZI|nr:Uu.00g104840.m01.CDS01 [Anthostomella pinea]
MASATFAIEGAIEAIEQDGFYYMEDPVIGDRIAQMDATQSPFWSSSDAGLEFYRLSVFQDERIKSILESFFERCALGDYRRLGQDRGHVFQLMRGGASTCVLSIQLWGMGSKAVYYRGSHKAPQEILGSVRAANRMWEVARARLERAGCEAKEIEFANGGIVIMDSRIAFEAYQGSPVTCSFATESRLSKWRRLDRPRSQGAAGRVAALQSERIGVYFDTEDERTGLVD